MNMKIKVGFISKQRNDAVRIVEQGLLKYLPNYRQKISIAFHIFPYNYQPLHSLWHMISLKTFFKLIAIYWQNDLIHFSSFDNYTIFYNLILKMVFRKPAILTVFHLEIDSFNAFLNRFGLYKKTILSFDRYIASSSFSKKQLMELGVNEVKISVLPLGIDNRLRFKKLKKKSPFPYLLFVGDEYPRKNIILLLKAFRQVCRRFPRIKLVKIGVAKNPVDAAITDQAVDRLKLQDKIILIRKYVSFKRLSQYYSQAKLLVSPSTLEGFGLPVAEAMRCRCLPLLSDIQTYRDYNLPEILYLKNLKQVDKLTKKIINLLQIRKKDKNKLLDNIYRRSLKYTWKKYTRQIVNIYEQQTNKI